MIIWAHQPYDIPSYDEEEGEEFREYITQKAAMQTLARDEVGCREAMAIANTYDDENWEVDDDWGPCKMRLERTP